MAKKAFVSLTGGLNNVDRPDTLEEDQLQECVNYEITGVGRLEKRTDPSQYSSNLEVKLSSNFNEVIFVSEPYYPPNKLDDSGIDKHILFIYGKGSNNILTMKLAILSSETPIEYDIKDSLQDLYDNGLEYTEASEIDISVGDRGVYICDSVNPIHKVTVDSRSNIVSSWVGLKAPLNKPRVSVETLNKQFDNTNSNIEYNESSGLGIGLIRCQYTVVSDTGQESNPSPASDFINAQYFKIADDGITDERLIKNIKIQDLNIPLVPDAVRDSLKYFKIYYQIIRYSEGVELDTMEFSSQVDIISKTTATIDTDNSYTISNIKTSGETISYENDAGFPCKISAINAGVLMVGGLKKSANIPGDFQNMTPINIDNQNDISVVDAVVNIKLRRGDIKDRDGNVVMPSLYRYFSTQNKSTTDDIVTRCITWKNYHDSIDADYPSRHLRIYDNDMTSPLMVYVKYRTYGHGDDSYVCIYVKIPLLRAGANHTIFFCWNDLRSSNVTESYNANPTLKSGHAGIADEYNKIVADEYDWANNIGAHYGRWILSTDDNNAAQTRQQVFQERRVATAATEILAIPHMASLGLEDDGREGYDLVNVANTSCHGEATTEQDPHIVQKTCLPPDSSNLTLEGEHSTAGWTPGDSASSYADSTASYWLMQNRFYDYEEKNEISVEGYQAIAYRLTELLGFNKHRQILIPLYRLRSNTTDSDTTNVLGDGSTVLQEDDLSVESVITNPDNSSTVPETGDQYSGYCTGSFNSTLGYHYTNQSSCLALEQPGTWTDWTELHDDWDLNRGRGYIRGLAPITSLGSHGVDLDNFLLNRGADGMTANTAFPSGYNVMNRSKAFNRLTPFLSTGTVDAKYAGDSTDPDDHYSAGAFKPFCAGWSFRKSAVNIGNIPDKGYIYTHIAFKTVDLQNAGSGSSSVATLRPTGSDSYNVENQRYWYQNTLFYVSCGSVNDIDAEPNHPLKHEPYPGKDAWEKPAKIGHTGAVEYIDAHYNADNFRPTSETGADPGAITITEEGDGSNANVPSNGNVETHGHAGGRNEDITYDGDVTTNTDPLTNIFFVTILKQETNPTRYLLRLFVRTTNDYDAHLQHVVTELTGVDNDTTQNMFIYLSWDIVNERFALGYRWYETDPPSSAQPEGVDDDGNGYGSLKIKERDYTAPTTEETNLKVKNAFRNKPLYDIGLGNSTYLNRVISSTNEHKTFNMSGFHGFYGTTEMTTGVYSKDDHFITAISENAPRFTTPVGYDYYNKTYNNKITIKDNITRTEKIYDNMIMWSEVNNDSLPDLNYKLLKEAVIKILAAPSFLKFEYSNTFLIFTRNTINRFVLKGTASGWSGSSESLIEEQIQYGLYAPDSLVKVGGEIFWLSEEGVIRWNTEGLQNISGNVIDISLDTGMKGFYCSVNNQYMLHNNTDNISYVYDLTYRRWTTFSGLDVIGSSLLTGGSNVENINLLLTSEGDVKRYPTDDKTSEDAHIKTKDIMMEAGSVKRIKLDYNGDTNANVVYTVKKVDSNNVEQTRDSGSLLDKIQKNVWRGTGDAGRLYGRISNIQVENADEIFSILYDVNTRGGE